MGERLERFISLLPSVRLPSLLLWQALWSQILIMEEKNSFKSLRECRGSVRRAWARESGQNIGRDFFHDK